MLLSLLPILLSCETQQPTPTEKQSPQNVLLIVIDTLRADYLEPYGAPNIISPNINKLAQSGVVIQKHFATSSWTRPGFATILTGLYPREVGIYEEQYDKLPDDVITLPEILKLHNYHTIGINSNPNIDPYFGFDQGFDSFDSAGAAYTWMTEVIDEEGKKLVGNPLLNATTITNKTLERVQQASSPWFAMSVYIDPHKPLMPPSEDIDAIKGLPDHYHPEYAAEIHFTDREIHRLIKALNDGGHLKNTYVIITADHGEGLWSHPNVPDSFEHGTHLYDSVNHVPFIILHPSLSARTVSELTSSISLMPTILELLNIPFENQLNRPSLVPLITSGKQNNLPLYAFSETQWRRLNKVSVRSSEQRYIYSFDAYNFQQKNSFEGKPPYQPYDNLDGPVEELYSYQSFFSFLTDKTMENWLNNEFNTDSNSPLKNSLFSWIDNHPERLPIQRNKEDGFTTFERSTDEMQNYIYHPNETTLIEKPNESLQEQLKQLGYLE
jgi:arylsulfatase A-like enzyme